MSYYDSFPSTWKDTPKNRQGWQRLQSNTSFLEKQQNLYRTLSCHYCGKGPLTIVHWSDLSSQNSLYKATVDHVVPRAHGGRDNDDNLVVSCGPCNYRKGANMPY
ncbi:hypothetical protein Agub_g1531 [Astrephomene gubernaculifera]|uniref:HNH nuclease domain-containing protein n=1 Tax=Astrephomene gubernaculifera TaxID=47775 RepID=A0AAD3HGW1_9CHLO|nr:hypothetical protein Agub_g1531 [Astrephomene gubernaculifera]